jgi:hypothetical protein
VGWGAAVERDEGNKEEEVAAESSHLLCCGAVRKLQWPVAVHDHGIYPFNVSTTFERFCYDARC